MKTGLFLDTSDLYHRTKRRYIKKLDYQKVFRFFEEEYQLISPIAYGIQSDHEATGFITCLKRAGYVTKFSKPGEIRTSDRIIRRSLANVEIAVDIMSRLSRLDCVILGSGNLEFVPLIRHIADQGIKTIIFSVGVATAFKQIATVLEVPECVLE